jgi:hypothetical protein
MLKRTSHMLVLTAAASVAAGAAWADSHIKDMSDIPAECGKQWTIVDRDNDGQVTVEEGKAFAEVEFGRLDANQDGKISQEEFDQCNDLSLSARIVGEANGSGDGSGTEPETFNGQPVINGMVMVDATVDENNDKVLTLEEAARAYDKAAAGNEDKVVSREDQARYAGSWFEAHDINNDGMVSMEESTMEPADNPYTAVFDDMDENGDGNITVDEWGSHYQKLVEDAQMKSKDSSGKDGGPVDAIWHFFFS